MKESDGRIIGAEPNSSGSTQHRGRFRRYVLTSTLMVVVLAMWNVFSGIDDWKRDFTTNDAALLVEATDPLLRPASFKENADELKELIQLWATKDSNGFQASDSSESEFGLHLTRTTRLLRFTDDIHVRLVRIAAGGTRVEAGSRSRVGKGDLGQNPRNLKELMGMLHREATLAADQTSGE